MPLNYLDISTFYYINHLPHPVLLDVIAASIHYATRSSLIYLPVLLILFLNKKFRKLFWIMLISGGLSILIVDVILKPLINRPRPYEVLANVIKVMPLPTNASFPSSQSATAAAVVISCILTLSGKWKHTLWLWLIVVGLDRIYMGHHYPSDVLAGVLTGGVLPIIIKFVFEKYPIINKIPV